MIRATRSEMVTAGGILPKPAEKMPKFQLLELSNDASDSFVR